LGFTKLQLFTTVFALQADPRIAHSHVPKPFNHYFSCVFYNSNSKVSTAVL